MNRGRLFLAAVLLIPMTCHAAERNFGISSFDRIRLEGPFRVEIVTGKASSARAIGDMRAIDRISFVANGTSLTIRQSRSAWGGMPGDDAGRVMLKLTTPALRKLVLSGAGDLHVDAVKAGHVAIQVNGSGNLGIDRLETLRLDAIISGAGKLMLGGKADIASFLLQGASSLAAEGLASDHLKLEMNGSGAAATTARKTADIMQMGNGTIRIAGTAVCKMDIRGSGNVACGKDVAFEAAPDVPASPPSATLETAPVIPAISRHPAGVRIHRGEAPRKE